MTDKIITTGTKNTHNGVDYFTHIGIHKDHISMWGIKSVNEVYDLVFEIHENQEKSKNYNDIDYWGWFDYGTNKVSMIYPSYNLFSICFPYGIDVEEKCNKGKAYRLKLVKIINNNGEEE